MVSDIYTSFIYVSQPEGLEVNSANVCFVIMTLQEKIANSNSCTP